MEANKVNDLINDFLTNAEILFDVTYQGLGQIDSGKANMDRWFFTLERKGNKVNFDYFTGFGHRLKPNTEEYFKVKATAKKYYHFYRYVSFNARDGDFMRVVMPFPTDLFYSLVMDFQGLQDAFGFSDWCECCGYDDDSIKALEIYRAVELQSKRLLSILTHSEIDKLSEIFKDY